MLLWIRIAGVKPAASLPAIWLCVALTILLPYPTSARCKLWTHAVGDLAFFAGGTDTNYPTGPNGTYSFSNVINIYNAATREWSVNHLAHGSVVTGCSNKR